MSEPKKNLPQHHPASRDELKAYAETFVNTESQKRKLTTQVHTAFCNRLELLDPTHQNQIIVADLCACWCHKL